MSYGRQPNSMHPNPNLSGLTLNLSQASIPTGPTLLPQFTPHRTEELSSFVGENPVNSKGFIPENEEKFLDPKSNLSENVHTLDVPSPPTFSSKPIASTTVKSNQRPRYVLPPDINTFVSNTSTSLKEKPSNSFKPSTTTFDANQLFPPLLPPSNAQHDDVQTAQLPVLMETTDRQTQYTNQNVGPPSMSSSSVSMKTTYHPVAAYWFYSTTFGNVSVWWPFSRHDSYQIETKFLRSCYSETTSENLTSSSIIHTSSSVDMKATIETHEIIVQVDGGRYDVHLKKRERRSVYWDESPGEVRRATWFYKPQGESRVLPFSERICDLLEAQYKLSVEQGQWGRRFDLPSEDRRGGSDVFIFNSPQSMIQYLAWPYDLSSTINSENVVAGTSSPLIQLDSSQLSHEMSLTGQFYEGRVCYLHRGLDDQLMEQIDEGDHQPIDQLFFIVHGIGSMYNLKGQGLIECANDMRRTAKQLHQTHFAHHPNRVEFLPILWHDELHSNTVTGLSKQLEQITLGSIPKLRQFTNDSLMDILFYTTSSKYSQLIMNTVVREMKRLRELFLLRNPNFNGNISIIGHSLGAVISFDLLCHQTAYTTTTTKVEHSPETLSSAINDSNHNTANAYPITDTNSQLTLINPIDSVNNELTEDAHGVGVISCSKGAVTSTLAVPATTTITIGTSGSGSSSSSCTNDSAGSTILTTTTTTTNTMHTNNALHLSSSLSSSSNNNSSSSLSIITASLLKDSSIHDNNCLLSDNGQTDEWTIVDNYHPDRQHHQPHHQRHHRDRHRHHSKSTLNNSSNNHIQELEQILLQHNITHPEHQIQSIIESIMKWTNGQLQPSTEKSSSSLKATDYPQLGFTISALYTLGSPIPLFLTARGIQALSREFHLPTCSAFYNLFHPFDPVAYRMETLIDAEFQEKSVLIPHYKGRKRIHLQLKDNLAWVGSELKNKFYNSVQSTWRSLHEFALAHKFIHTSNEEELDMPSEENDYHQLTDNRNDVVTTTYRDLITHDLSFNSQLNQGRRIDYVLQEAPLESFNEYLFALTSHATYWDSIDTVLFILTEAYAEQGIIPLMPNQKNQLPQSSSTIHVRALSPPLISSTSSSIRIAPHSMPNPTSSASSSSSIPVDLFVNVNSPPHHHHHQVSGFQHLNHSVSSSYSTNSNQSYPPVMTTMISSSSSSNVPSASSGMVNIPPTSLSYMTPPSVIAPPPTTTNTTTTTTSNIPYMQYMTTDPYYQTSVSSQYYSAACLPPTPISYHSSDSSTQQYFTPQISTSMSQGGGGGRGEFSNIGSGNLIQPQQHLQQHQQPYSTIPTYVHRKPTSLANPTTSVYSPPSIVPYHPTMPITTTTTLPPISNIPPVYQYHPIPPVSSPIIPDLLCTSSSSSSSVGAVVAANTFTSTSLSVMQPPLRPPLTSPVVSQ
ncbi:unnamed protein product [Schistosoma turkestanicum]|nr:unnamed protein product [Schistosoma turkestanicum]